MRTVYIRIYRYIISGTTTKYITHIKIIIVITTNVQQRKLING